MKSQSAAKDSLHLSLRQAEPTRGFSQRVVTGEEPDLPVSGHIVVALKGYVDSAASQGFHYLLPQLSAHYCLKLLRGI